jgi:uncharacterized membrane protein required for colicin V production
MIFNTRMSIWILAILVLAAVALAGWRQGAIRAGISLVGILVAALLAAPIGKIFHWLLPHLGVDNPIYVWALSPVCGFILVSIFFKVAAQSVHSKVEVFYKYKAGDLRLTLWERLNARLGICVGLLNGSLYFILINFLIFNLSYWTVQTAGAANQTTTTRLVNRLGGDLQSTGLSRSAAAVSTLPPMFYKLADLSGFLVQNPAAGVRFAEYPGLVSLWERDDMQPLVQDNGLTNSLAAGASLGQIIGNPSVQELLKNKALSRTLWDTVTTNYDDLKSYLETGKSAKFEKEKLVGRWEFNPRVTLAWLRQDRPKMTATEMRAVRTWMFQSYSQTRLLVAGDNQVFIRSLPRVKAAGAGQPPTTELNNWKGDWSLDGNSYTLHVSFETEEKFLVGNITSEGIRLTIKDGKNTLIFDRAD